jgi:predicted Rossmann-fold nucleotide-binding protein
MTITPPILHENLPLLEVADGVLLDMIAADPQARKLILVRLSDRAAIVTPGGFDALLARLRKLGHTPKVVED